MKNFQEANFRTIHYCKTIFTLLVLLVLAMPGIEGYCADANIQPAETISNRLPMYHNNQLQFFVYSRENASKGGKIDATDVIIDIIRKDVNVDSIKFMNNLTLYQLGTPAVKALDFWKDKLHSEGIIISSAAQIDTGENIVSGSEKVYFRSPLMDIDGIGFRANYDKRTVIIRKNVKIIVRKEISKSFQQENDKSNSNIPDCDVDMTSDTVFIDFENDRVILEGNARLNKYGRSFNCEKLCFNIKWSTVEWLSGYLKKSALNNDSPKTDLKNNASKVK